MNIKNSMILTNKKCLLTLLFIIFLLFSCEKKIDNSMVFQSLLTSDSIQFWDSYTINENERITYSFEKSGRCEIFALGQDGKRRIFPFDSIPNEIGICNRWKLINDSTINIMCSDNYRIVSYSNDSILLKKLNRPEENKLRILYKVKGSLKVDKERMEWRDSIIQIRREQKKIYDAKVKNGQIIIMTEKSD